MVIELDGSQHGEASARDARRDAFMDESGWTVLRFWNDEAFANLDGVLETIFRAANDAMRRIDLETSNHDETP